MQFHEDDNTKVRTSILLGTWNPENHLDWLQRNGKKRPLANIEERKISSLFYSNGQTCEGTNKKRSVEIKFKCTQRTESSHAISLYLLEPQICEYLLVIESSWLCNFIKQTDMNGIPKSVENIAEDFID